MNKDNKEFEIDDDFEYDAVGGRVYGSNYEEQLNIIGQEYGDEGNTFVGTPINVYKFRKVSGIVRLTNEGERSIKYSNDIFHQSTNVYTGKSPVVVVWEGSTKAYVNDNDKIIKEMKVGTYYQLYFETAKENNLTIDNINILGKDYVNTYIERDIKLISKDWNPTDDDMLEYVYLILDNTNQSKQWLEIQSTNPKYHIQTKEFMSCEITFANINLKYSKTGKTLIDFIQLGAIGEGYAFPKETKDDITGEIIVSLDEELKLRKNDGTNQIQFDFNSGVGNSSFIFWGRPKEKLLSNGDIELDKPKMLFPYRANFPKSSEFFYNRPNMNSYYGTNWKPVKNEIWASYKEAYSRRDITGEYNIDKEKEVLVGFQHNEGEIQSTNHDINTYINWDNKKSVSIDLQNINLTPIPYVKKIDTINRFSTYCEFFTINAFLNWYTDIFNYDYRETTKYKLTDTLGILGSIVNILVNGLDIGWTLSSTLGPNQPMNFLLPCISFEDGKSALGSDAPLPSDIFIDSNVKKILPTATNVLTSWNFNLTDRFIDETMIVEGAEIGKGGSGIWDTKYLGQTKDENGNWLLPSQKAVELNLNKFIPFSPSQTNGFIIDYLDFKAIGNCDYRISSYNILNENTYSVYLETNAKARDEITLWGNTMKFNYYDEFNTLGSAKWPENVEIPIPTPEEIGIEYNVDWSFLNFEINERESLSQLVPLFNLPQDTFTKDNIKVYGPSKQFTQYCWLARLDRWISTRDGFINVDKTKTLSILPDELPIGQWKSVFVEFSNGKKVEVPLSFDINGSYNFETNNYSVDKKEEFGVKIRFNGGPTEWTIYSTTIDVPYNGRGYGYTAVLKQEIELKTINVDVNFDKINLTMNLDVKTHIEQDVVGDGSKPSSWVDLAQASISFPDRDNPPQGSNEYTIISQSSLVSGRQNWFKEQEEEFKITKIYFIPKIY